MKTKVWALFSPEGLFIAAFRFKPKQYYFKEDRYYAWTDCNGARFDTRFPDIALNTIEGSMNAKCKQITIEIPWKNHMRPSTIHS